MFVLDEADEMLSRGFKDQIYDIFKYLPPSVQVALFSATMPPEILDLTSKYKLIARPNSLPQDIESHCPELFHWQTAKVPRCSCKSLV